MKVDRRQWINLEDGIAWRHCCLCHHCWYLGQARGTRARRHLMTEWLHDLLHSSIAYEKDEVVLPNDHIYNAFSVAAQWMLRVLVCTLYLQTAVSGLRRLKVCAWDLTAGLLSSCPLGLLSLFAYVLALWMINFRRKVFVRVSWYRRLCNAYANPITRKRKWVSMVKSFTVSLGAMECDEYVLFAQLPRPSTGP